MSFEELTKTMRENYTDIEVADTIAQQTIAMIEAGEISISDALCMLRLIAHLKRTGRFDEVLAMLDAPPIVDDGIPPFRDH